MARSEDPEPQSLTAEAIASRPADNTTPWAYGYAQGRSGVALADLLKEAGTTGLLVLNNPASTSDANPAHLVDILTGFAEGLEEAARESRQAVEELKSKNGKLQEQIDKDLSGRAAELVALHKVNSAANSSLDLDAILNLTVDAIAEVMHSDACSIYMYEAVRNDLTLRATTRLNPEKASSMRVVLQIGEGVTGWAALQGKPIAVRDAWSDPHFRYIPDLNEEDFRSQLSVPVILFSKERLQAVINIQTRDYRDFTREEIDFLEMVAGEIAMAIENARLYQETDDKLRRKVNELTILQRVSAAIAATLELPEVLNLIATQAVQLSSAEMSAIFALDEHSKSISVIASCGFYPRLLEEISFQPGESIIKKVVQGGVPVSITDALNDDRVGNIGPLVTEEGYRSMLCLPLITPRGILGGICLYGKGPRAFQDEEFGLLSAFANEAAIAIENARLYEETRRGLDVKSALLQEMHHRVRNNLQTVAALLSMQMRRAKLSPAEEALGESVARIQSIAAIHDLLSGEKLGQATVHEIAHQVFDTAAVNLVPPGKRIEFNIDHADVLVSSREATLIAIIINELLANAIRHAFAGADEGSISIKAQQDKGTTRIEVTDNGLGYPPSFDLKENAGLGLQIVQTLVSKDLHGAFTMESTGNGTRSVIVFPNEPLELASSNS